MEEYNYKVPEEFAVGKKVYQRKDVVNNDLTWLKSYIIHGHVLLKDDLNNDIILIVISEDLMTAEMNSLLTVKQTKDIVKKRFDDEFERIFNGVN